MRAELLQERMTAFQAVITHAAEAESFSLSSGGRLISHLCGKVQRDSIREQTDALGPQRRSGIIPLDFCFVINNFINLLTGGFNSESLIKDGGLLREHFLTVKSNFL